MTATLNVVGGQTFTFITAKTVGGRIPDLPVSILEDLTADGVDFKRHLLNRKEFRQFEIRTMAATTDYQSAVRMARNYEKSIGFTATLTSNIRSVFYSWEVYIIDVPESPLLLSGSPIGTDVPVGSGGGLTARWILELITIPLINF